MKDTTEMDDDTDHSHDEMKYLHQAQDALEALKSDIRSFINAMSQMMAINNKAGRKREGNAALLMKGSARKILGDIEKMHADGTELLYVHWPEHVDEITTRSGHR